MGSLISNVRPNVMTNVRPDVIIPGEIVATITTTKVGTFTMTLRGYAGSLTVDWGDGSAPEIVTLLGVGTNVPVPHNYVLSGNKTILITGDIDNITLNYCSARSVVSVDFVNMTSLTSVTYSDNLITNIYPFTVINPLSVLSLQGNPVEYPLTGLSWPTYSSGTIRFNSTVDSSAEVDRYLIDFAVAGWNHLTLYLDGTNPARTSASDAAVATLLGNAVVLYVNS